VAAGEPGGDAIEGAHGAEVVLGVVGEEVTRALEKVALVGVARLEGSEEVGGEEADAAARLE